MSVSVQREDFDIGAEVARLPTRQNAIDLIELFKHLVWLEVNEVLVEAGATLCGTLLQHGFIRQYHQRRFAWMLRQLQAKVRTDACRLA